MMPTPDLAVLLLGLGGFLLLASLVGYLLHLFLSPDGSNALIENLNDRIRAWWVMVALMAVALLEGKAGITLLFAFSSFAALREFITLLDTRRSDHWSLAAAFFVMLPAQYYLVYIDWYGFYAIMIPVYGFLLLPIIAVLRGETSEFLTRIAELQWALMISVYAISHVPALLSLDIPGFAGRNLLLIAFLIIVVQSSDVMQYAFGKLMGRTRIAPAVSPSKTVEGLVGGSVAAIALGASLSWITPFSPLQAAGMSCVIVLLGFLGGLVMSAIKRDRGVKDWGQMIPGHGGVIDRLDSVIFSAPIFFHLTRYFWAQS